jgi:hypothetical protein
MQRKQFYNIIEPATGLGTKFALLELKNNLE